MKGMFVIPTLLLVASCSFVAPTSIRAWCKGGQFRCDNGKCIHPSYKCNKWNDCVDNSDEQDCECFSSSECPGLKNCRGGTCRGGSSGDFEGFWSGQIMCPQQKGDLEVSITSSCTEEKFTPGGPQFKCIATDCVVVKGKLPHGLSEADVLKFSREYPSLFRVIGYKIEDLHSNQFFYFYKDGITVDFDEVNFPLFGLCSGRWVNKGLICDVDFSCENGGTCDYGRCSCLSGFRGIMCQQITDILAIHDSLLIKGANATSIIVDMPILEKILADATNSSLTEVKILVKSSGHCNNEPDACTAITVEIRPRDRNHETYVISKMKLTKDCLTPPYPPCKSFLVNELNLRLQNLTTENDLSFLSQYEHYRVPYDMDQINRSMGPYDWRKFRRTEEMDTRDVLDDRMNIRGDGSRCSDSDVEPWKTYCSSWKRYCYDSMVQSHCRKTCNTCGGGGGGDYRSFPSNRVVLDEGQNYEAHPGLYPTECQTKCDQRAGCNSFVFCTDYPGSSGVCMLRGRILIGSEPTKPTKGCTSYYLA